MFLLIYIKKMSCLRNTFMSYSKSPTLFCDWAIARGCREVYQGWGLLVEQAAESFLLWRGVRPDTAPVLAVLLDHNS